MCFAFSEATREINIQGVPCACMNNVRNQKLHKYAK